MNPVLMRISRWNGARLRSGAFALVWLTGLAACGSETMEPVYADPETLYWRLEVDRPAIVMSIHAPYDTVRVTATPVNVYGMPVPATESATFTKVNTADATFDLSPDGLITARGTSSEAQVKVALTMHGIKRTADVRIQITSVLPVRKFRAISVQPMPPDSSHRWLFGANANLAHRAYYADNNALVPSSGWKRFFLSRNPGIFAFNGGEGQFSTTGAFDGLVYQRIGEAWIILRSFVYGDDLVDSVLLKRVDVPLKAVEVVPVTPKGGQPTLRFQPQTLTINAGTTVAWRNQATKAKQIPEVQIGCTPAPLFGCVYDWMEWGDSIDVIFDNPADVQPGQGYNMALGGWFPRIGVSVVDGVDPTGLGGNIPLWSGRWFRIKSPALKFGFPQFENDVRSRKFTVAGTYHYRSLRYPASQGTIIVR